MNTFPGETDETAFPAEDRLFPKPGTETEADDEAERIRAERVELRKVGLTNCMNQPWFREWLMEYLVSLGTFGHTFGASPTGFPDPHATFFHMGMKSAGETLWLQFDDLSPDLAALMRREARNPKGS